MYRYKKSTREEHINAIKKVKDRIWIPHLVALEFQKGRLKVISGQIKGLKSISKVIASAKDNFMEKLNALSGDDRHPLIDQEDLKNKYNRCFDGFADMLKDLTELEKKQQKTTTRDHIKEEIEDLFINKVGSPPVDQSSIDKSYEIAQENFAKKIPPGFKDSNKDEEFVHGGICYKSKFGDYTIWNDTLKHAKQLNTECFVFVTDENKDDWLYRIEGETIGPLPNLIEQACQSGEIKHFYLFNAETFLRNAKLHNEAIVSKNSLEDISSIANERLTPKVIRDKLLFTNTKVERIRKNFLKKHIGSYFQKWLLSRHYKVYNSIDNRYFHTRGEGDNKYMYYEIVPHEYLHSKEQILNYIKLYKPKLINNTVSFLKYTYVVIGHNLDHIIELSKQFNTFYNVNEPHTEYYILFCFFNIQNGSDADFCDLEQIPIFLN